MSIPLLDADAPSFATDMIAACDDIGFFAVQGHGVELHLLQAMRDLCVELFDLDQETKHAFQITPSNYRGFIPLGFFTPNRAEVNGTSPDLYEGFKLHWECPSDHPVASECDLYGPNRWIAAVPQMEAVVSQYWLACERLTMRLLDVIAESLELDAHALRAWHNEPLTNMTLLHYPASPASPVSTAPHGGTAAAGIHAHKDTNVLTVLHPDPVGGLEVQTPDGDWITVDTPNDALVINTGEMLELWSGGRFAATPHRVVNRTGRRRYSFPWFLVPRHDVVVEPLVSCVAGFEPTTMPVGSLSAEVWRTNWPDEQPSSDQFDLGSLNR